MPARPREPILNIPAVVSLLLALMAAIHALRMLVLTPRQDADVLLTFSFIPIRYHAGELGVPFPGGAWAELWTPLSYGLLHGDLTHLAINGTWMAAFGSALAWRFGWRRFLAFSALATVAGAGAHYLAHPDEVAPMVGASAAISGHMAAVARFMFQGGGIMAPGRGRRRPAVRALTLAGAFADRRVLVFLGVWFGLNILVGIGGAPLVGAEGTIAWEAHIGGFLFGLFAFSLFDPPIPDPAVEPEARSAITAPPEVPDQAGDPIDRER